MVEVRQQLVLRRPSIVESAISLQAPKETSWALTEGIDQLPSWLEMASLQPVSQTHQYRL